MEYRYLRKSIIDGTEKIGFCDQKDAEFIMLPINEYNGYQNAIRIVRERAIQQINKSEADEHGYKLLRADLRKYEDTSDKAWLVTKSTPYSIKMNVREAKYMITKDLLDFYNYCGFRAYMEDNMMVRFTGRHFARACGDYQINKEQNKDYVGQNSEMGRSLYKIMDMYDGVLSFEISKISVNYASGTYEVSYWATDLI